MAKISFRGLCSGTSQKVGRTSNKPYTITTFVEVPSLKTFDVFGDLGLPAHDDVREYVLEANIKDLQNVEVVQGATAVNHPKK